MGLVTKIGKAIALAAMCGLVSAACSSEAIEEVVKPEDDLRSPLRIGPLSCETDLAEIISLLRSGLPSYDYEPAGDFDVLYLGPRGRPGPHGRAH